jgi:hypothetical protein
VLFEHPPRRPAAASATRGAAARRSWITVARSHAADVRGRRRTTSVDNLSAVRVTARRRSPRVPGERLRGVWTTRFTVDGP